MILTIAMVVYNEEKRLPLIRGNLQVFKKYAAQLNVIIVDNGSNDKTVAQLIALQKEFQFHLAKRTVNNMGGARAQAVDLSSTAWLAFLDGDCTVDEAWVDLTLQTVGQLPPSVAAFGGPWIPAGKSGQLFVALFKTFFGHFNMPQIQLGDLNRRRVRHIPTACVVYRRQDLVSAGNFDPHQARVGEDLDMSYRLLSRGHELMMMPELRFLHYLPENLACWIGKIFTYGNARIRMAFLHKDVMAVNYLLPILFFIFLFLNAMFIARWKAVPLAAYLLTAMSVSIFTAPSVKAFRIFGYMVATHLAYSSGMVWGVCALTYEKILKRKQHAPRHCKPRSLEETL